MNCSPVDHKELGHNLATFTSLYKFKKWNDTRVFEQENQYKMERRNGRERGRQEGRKAGSTPTLIFHTSLEKSKPEKVDEHKYFRKQGTQIYKKPFKMVSRMLHPYTFLSNLLGFQ